MAVLGFYILLIFAVSCSAAPNLEKDHCQKPEQIKGAQLQGEWHDETYPPGKVANFACLPEYTQDGPIKMACIEGTWWHIAKGQCKESAKQCGPPPTVQFADTVEIRKSTYNSGESVNYRCPEYYTLEGNMVVRCLNGVWDKAPVCQEPCTAKEKDMEENNIQLKWRYNKKLYTTHGDSMEFDCKSGFEAPPDTQMRITCDKGKLKYPKCFKRESAKQCGPPPTVQFADTVEIRKSTYNSGESVNYRCPEYYTLEGNMVVRCLNGVWDKAPVCQEPCITNEKDMEENNIQLLWISARAIHIKNGDMIEFACKPGYETSPDTRMRISCQQGKLEYPKCIKKGTGVQCGPPPTVQYGDTLETRKSIYKSGEKVEFRCPEYYILKGNRFGTCFNGVWSAAPVCLEPCTAKERDMENNNIQLKWVPNRKLYSRHGDAVQFVCKPGYEAPPDTQMRSTCQQGKLEYPKCFKRGFCVLQQSAMIANNIHYNLSTAVDHGETILFQCNEGMMAENKLEAKCELRNMNYPRCTAAKSCRTPEIQNGFLKTEPQASYNSGSYVEFDCNEGYMIDVAMKVKCENGQWSKLPVCYSPCKISPEELTKHNIQLLSSNDPKNIHDKNYKHGTEISVTCKSGFRRSASAALVLECYDGKFRYPRCFSGRTCRILQDDLDENNLELDEVHDNEVFYAEGEVIQFKCKNGFEYRGRPTGICSGQALSYPKCTDSSI